MKPLRLFKETVEWWNVGWHVIGWLGLTSLLSGLAVAVGGAIWAVIIGVPKPIAIMAGFCTLAATICLTLVPSAYRVLAKAPAAIAESKPPEPNYNAVRLRDEFSIEEASCLWCDLDPNTGASTLDTAEWRKVLLEAVKKGKLELIPESFGRGAIEMERRQANRYTRVSRAELKKFAASIKEDPKFLRD